MSDSVSLTAMRAEVEERLRETEKCDFVNELTEIVSTPKGVKDVISSYVCFIRNVNTEFERSILIMRVIQGKKKCKVVCFLPIRKDFKLSIVSEKEFVLIFQNQMSFHFRSDNTMVMWSVITELTNIARELSLRRVSQVKFLWMKPYENKKWDDIFLKSEEREENPGHQGFAFQKQKKNMNVREIWLRDKLKERADEYTVEKKIKVAVGTWNVNMKLVKNPPDLAEWLNLHEKPDIIAVGLQEVDMSATALFREETDAYVQWDRIFREAVRNAPRKYTVLHSKQLVGVYLIVMISSDLFHEISDPRVQKIGCGALGTMGNKGCVAIRFQLCQSTFCFISSHLAAHQNAVEKRNQNYHFLEGGVNFGDDPRRFNCKVHDILFWMGDLNYRVDLPYEKVKEKIFAGEINYLLQHDQLGKEKRKKTVFVGYEEAPVTFRCTYKYDPGTNIYDTSEKKRTPSWTDRVQWKKNASIKNLLYTSYNKYLISDHKPVIGLFEVGVKEIVQEKYKKLYSEFIKTLDRVDNEMRPEIEITPKSLVFDKVEFGVPQTKTLTIRNTGRVVGEFAFVPKPGEGGKYCEPWLKISTRQGIVIPEEGMDIKFTVKVDLRSVAQMNRDQKFHDILIIHLKNGGDKFVEIQGTYYPSSFGYSIRNLLLYDKGVREPSSRIDLETGGSKKVQKIPKEVWHIVNYLYKNAMKESNLFLDVGREEEVKQIQYMLDHGKSLEDFHGSNHSMAQALLILLKNFEEPVLPTRFHRLAVMMSKMKLLVIYREFLMKRLPPEHFNMFQYITSFLRELLKPKYCKQNQLTKEKLAIIFSKVLIRTKSSGPLSRMSKESEADENGKIMFMKKFLDYHQEWNDPKTGMLLKDISMTYLKQAKKK